MKQWIPTALLKPNNERIVEAQDYGGNVHKLRFYKNLWWLTDMTMYVYFTPIAWKEIS